MASDIMKSRHHPWVCSRLEEFELSIHVDLKDPYDKEAHQHIFARLSGLTRLKRLDLFGDLVGPMGMDSILERVPYPTLSLRLPLGLGQLETLQGLTNFLFNGFDEKMTMADWRFLMTAFPLSCSISNTIHPAILQEYPDFITTIMGYRMQMAVRKKDL